MSQRGSFREALLNKSFTPAVPEPHPWLGEQNLWLWHNGLAWGLIRGHMCWVPTGGLTPNQLCGGMKNLTLMSKGRMTDKGAKVRKAMPFKLGLKLATQRCVQMAPGSGWRMSGKSNSEVERLVVTEELVDTVPSPSSLERPACEPWYPWLSLG